MSEDPLSEIAMNIYLKNCEPHENFPETPGDRPALSVHAASTQPTFSA